MHESGVFQQKGSGWGIEIEWEMFEMKIETICNEGIHK